MGLQPIRSPNFLLVVILAIGFLALCPKVTPAADLRNVLEGYSIASWGRKDGLPTSLVRTLAQDHDGYLWIGTDAGLVRFDGVEFVPWEVLSATPLPARSIRVLFVSQDGSLWVGYGEPAGLTRIDPNHVVQNYGEADGLAVGRAYLSSLSEDRQGTVWAGRNDGLYRFAADRWERWPAGRGVAPGLVRSTYVDAHGTVTVGTRDGVFALREGAPAFERIGDSDGEVRSIGADRFGRLWVTDPITGIRLATDRPGTSPHGERGVGGQIVSDRAGYLWLTSIQGLWRLQAAQKAGEAPILEKATAATGLLADGLTCLLEDRDGNIWVGTSDGLNRLKRHTVTSRTDLGFASAVASTATGIWLSSVDELINFPQSVPDAGVERHRFDGTIATMHADAQGAIWIATHRGVFRREPAGNAPLQQVMPLTRVTLIASDVDGGLWLNDQDRGLLRWDGRQLETIPDVPQPIQVIHGRTDGSVWAALADGRLAVIARDRQMRIYGATDGLLTGGYNVIYEGHDGVMWLGAIEGLTRFAAGRFTTLLRSNTFPLQSIRALEEDDAGRLWIGTEAGIYGIERDALERAFKDNQPINYTLFDLTDGLAGFPLFAAGHQRAVRDPTGQLWFITHRGLSVIDPRRGLDHAPRAPVRIAGITVGDRQFRPAPQLVLPARTSRLQVEYAMLNLTWPQKTRFRYRLEGFDEGWIDAGARRQALYTNLVPRRYRFMVQADSNEGAWGPPAILEFAIAPLFYQTLWFASTCTVTVAAALWAAWQLRVRRIHKEFALVLGERTRLSREIHDTLLQSLVGIALQCDAIAADVGAPGSPARHQLGRMRRQAEEFVRDARQSIWDLRSPTLERRSLAEALRDAAERATAGKPIRLEFSVSGEPRRCRPKVEEQLLRIGQEAVTNAVRHAQPSRLRMALRYDGASVTLEVSDDGCGFDPLRVVDASHDHFGLMTMKERAAELGATLQIDSGDGQGTTILATVSSAPLADT